tara:strand:+ start:762 stop:1484 length:723 start_codon:yes stop_codon:yes gene_type:complete
MPLPKLDVPTYEMNLTSGDTITYRPFLVKEEKILFMALEGESTNEMGRAMKQIITNCVTEDINIDDLPLFELENVLLKIRSKSVSEKAEVAYLCQETHENEVCNNRIELNVDLNDVELEINEDHTNEILLTDNVGILMRYPKLDLMDREINLDNQNTDDIFRIIEGCVECVFDEENTYTMDDYSEDERTEFFESLTQEQFTSIRGFFDTIPKLRFRDVYECDKCGKESELVLEGLENFFV